jgi:hypothetical protein
VLVGEPTTVGYGRLQDAIANELYGHGWPTLRVPAVVARVGAWVREQNPIGGKPFIRSWMVDRASDHYELDIDEAIEHLDWSPEHDVLATIPEMVQRLRRDRDGWYATNSLQAPRRLPLPA